MWRCTSRAGPALRSLQASRMGARLRQRGRQLSTPLCACFVASTAPRWYLQNGQPRMLLPLPHPFVQFKLPL